MHKAAGGRIRSFHLRYAELCRTQNIKPLPDIKGKAKDLHTCEVQGDKLSVTEWIIISDSLQFDTVLNVIKIRMKKCIGYVLDSCDTEAKAKCFRQKSPIYTKYVFSGLINALVKELESNKNLCVLNLEGLPLNGQWIELIAKAMCSSTSLKEISVQHSNIGDNGCDAICCSIKYTGVVEKINLSDCGLTAKSGEYIANVIRMQKIQRFSEGWEKSLRYQPIDLESIKCLNTIIIAQNPWLSDNGAKLIIEALKEDVFIHHVDMQDCNLTNNSALLIIDLIKANKNLHSFEVKGNDDIDKKLLQSIYQHFEKDDQSIIVSSTEDNENAKMIQMSEELNALEKRLAIECDLRKKAENLSLNLNEQVLCMESKFQVVVPTAKIPDGFVVVCNKILETVVQERNNLQELAETVCPSRINTPRLVLNALGEKKHFVRIEPESPLVPHKSLPMNATARKSPGLQRKVVYINNKAFYIGSDTYTKKKTARPLQIYTKESQQPTLAQIETGIGDSLDNLPMTSKQAELLMSARNSAKLAIPKIPAVQTNVDSEESDNDTLCLHKESIMPSANTSNFCNRTSERTLDNYTNKNNQCPKAEIETNIGDTFDNTPKNKMQSTSMISGKSATNSTFIKAQQIQNDVNESEESDDGTASSHTLMNRSLQSDYSSTLVNFGMNSDEDNQIEDYYESF